MISDWFFAVHILMEDPDLHFNNEIFDSDYLWLKSYS